MNIPLFLFCGGRSIDVEGRPKPLMKVRESRSLLVFYLNYLERHRPTMPSHITLLCDAGQEAAFQEELRGLSYPVSIQVQACGSEASTFEKLESALHKIEDKKAVVQFSYPDIFSFNGYSAPKREDLELNNIIHISAATLISRFPRLILDVYKNEIRGISNYSSPVPANPHYVFGGDLWAQAHELLILIREFKSQREGLRPSLEYDFFFWLINQKKMRCVILHGERLWVDSVREVQQLLSRMETD